MNLTVGKTMKIDFGVDMNKLNIPQDIKYELENFKKTRVPRCQKCFKNFEPAVDSITKKKSKYSWKPTCDCCNPDLRLHIG